MGNEMWQARLDDDFSSKVHEWREKNHMSKSEVVRHGLRELVDEDDDGTPDETPDTRRMRTSQLITSVPSMIAVGIVLGLGVILYGALTGTPTVAPAPTVWTGLGLFAGIALGTTATMSFSASIRDK